MIGYLLQKNKSINGIRMMQTSQGEQVCIIDDDYEPTKTVPVDQQAAVLLHCRLLNGKEGAAGWGRARRCRSRLCWCRRVATAGHHSRLLEARLVVHRVSIVGFVSVAAFQHVVVAVRLVRCQRLPLLEPHACLPQKRSVLCFLRSDKCGLAYVQIDGHKVWNSAR